MINLLVCVNEDFYIGKNNDLLYHISDDLKRFKWLTSSPNSYMLMGRSTFQSLPRPFKDRTNVIFTRNKKFKVDKDIHNKYEILIEHDVKRVINHYTQTGYNDNKVLNVVGGSEIYSLFLPYVNRIYLTMVHDNKKGDTCFPSQELSNFTITYKEKHFDEEIGLYYSFINYKRKEDLNG